MKYLSLLALGLVSINSLVSAAACNFDELEIIFYKDDKCREIDYARTRKYI